MSRVMLCHCRAGEEHALLDDGLSFVSCDDSESMLAELVLNSPDLVVYQVRPESDADLAVLHLLRRAAPRIPLVVVGGGPSPMWDLPEIHAPVHRLPLPVGEADLREVVLDALPALAGVS